MGLGRLCEELGPLAYNGLEVLVYAFSIGTSGMSLDPPTVCGREEERLVFDGEANRDLSFCTVSSAGEYSFSSTNFISVTGLLVESPLDWPSLREPNPLPE